MHDECPQHDGGKPLAIVRREGSTGFGEVKFTGRRDIRPTRVGGPRDGQHLQYMYFTSALGGYCTIAWGKQTVSGRGAGYTIGRSL